MVEHATKQEVELPGVPIQMKGYEALGPYSLELFGEPTSNGYTGANLRWWHRAYHPLVDSPLDPGDPCFAVLDGYTFYTDRTFSVSFDSLERLAGVSLTPSVMCALCGLHVVIRVKELGEQDG